METVKRSLRINIVPLSNAKSKALHRLEAEYKEVLHLLKDGIEYWDEVPGSDNLPYTKFNLHSLFYDGIRSRSPLQAQTIIDAHTDAWANRKDPCARIRHPSIPFNVPRCGGLRYTRRGNPVITIATDRSRGPRMALPISRDGAWRRLKGELDNGWTFTHFKLHRRAKGKPWKIIITIKKDFEVVEPLHASTILGIDLGSGTLAAVSIIDMDGRIRRQLYFGRDIANKQRDIDLRRTKLKKLASKGSRKARRKLRELKTYESNFVKTRCYEIAHDIVKLAQKFNSTISIEKLGFKRKKKKRRKKKERNIDSKKDKKQYSRKAEKKGNRKRFRIPFGIIREALVSVAHQNCVAVSIVDPKYTSQTCNKCQSRNESYRNGALFTCGECGLIVNADRNASVNIARKLLPERPQGTEVPTKARFPGEMAVSTDMS